MSKKITHEQARERKQNIITKQIALSSDIYSVRLIPISADETNIKEIQDFIEKQQKLLKLYKEYYELDRMYVKNNFFLELENLNRRSEIVEQIKELENEI